MYLSSMNLRLFGPDEPPAPQEPPNNYIPLSPPRLRQRSSTVGSIMTSTLWHSDPIPSSLPHPPAPKERARSVDQIWSPLRRLRNLLPAGKINLCFIRFKAHLVRTVSRDETRPAVGASTPVDGCPSQEEDKNVISTITWTADSEADVHTSVSENESQSVLTTCGVEMIRGTASAAVLSLTDSARISHPSATQVADDAQMSSEVFSHPINTNDKSSVSSLLVEDERQDSEVTIGSKRTKPISLVLTSTRKENLETSGIPTPRTAPPVTARSPRPLPPLPGVLRLARPLPQPPVLPPYTSPAGSPPLYGASQSPSAISSSVSQATARLPADVVLDKLSDQPNISRRPVAPVILADPSSENPLALNIPSSSSLVAAKPHQSSESSEIISDMLGTSDTLNQTTIPVPRFRDADVLKRRHRMQIVRPQAIYLLGNFSDELYENGEGGCTSESSISESLSESLSTSLDLPVDVDAEEDLDDKSFMFSSEDGIIPEELDDLEEADIGWASQNIVNYQKESCVKRATRAWILESNGQVWQELNNLREA